MGVRPRLGSLNRVRGGNMAGQLSERERRAYQWVEASLQEGGSNMDTITPHNVVGSGGCSWTDVDGNYWIGFEVDYFGEQTDAECAICGEPLTSSWLCLYGSDKVCRKHVTLPG